MEQNLERVQFSIDELRKALGDKVSAKTRDETIRLIYEFAAIIELCDEVLLVKKKKRSAVVDAILEHLAAIGKLSGLTDEEGHLCADIAECGILNVLLDRDISH